MEARKIDVSPGLADDRIVAILPSQEQVIDERADGIKGEIALIREQAEGITISDDAQYALAAETGREIKRKARMATDLFAPIKEAANKAHKAACAQERKMLAPLQEAERAIKAEMSRYIAQRECKRREAEAEARRRAEEEAARLLQQAVAADASGDEIAAFVALDEAQAMSEASHAVSVSVSTPQAEGVTVRKDWSIQIIDQSKVPVWVAGVTIRPVDETAVMRMVRASKGAIQIPGIWIKEETRTILRR